MRRFHHFFQNLNVLIGSLDIWDNVNQYENCRKVIKATLLEWSIKYNMQIKF